MVCTGVANKQQVVPKDFEKEDAVFDGLVEEFEAAVIAEESEVEGLAEELGVG